MTLRSALPVYGKKGCTKIRIRLTVISLALAFLIWPASSMGQESNSQPQEVTAKSSKKVDFNRKIYYRNKLEFSFESAYYPFNTGAIFDGITTPYPLHYTLVPFIASLRWQLSPIRGPSFLRGNTDLTTSLSYTWIPRGPEKYYFAYIMGLRRNFVQPNWKVAPYLEGRAGLGLTDAQGPKGVMYAQGQNFTFTIMLASGVRYNFDSRYSVSAGWGYMHISNAYLSLPVTDWGINVHGPTFGFNVRLGKPK
jgi:Lipid A 3-O-deacylase (PagL)